MVIHSYWHQQTAANAFTGGCSASFDAFRHRCLCQPCPGLLLVNFGVVYLLRACSALLYACVPAQFRSKYMLMPMAPLMSPLLCLHLDNGTILNACVVSDLWRTANWQQYSYSYIADSPKIPVTSWRIESRNLNACSSVTAVITEHCLWLHRLRNLEIAGLVSAIVDVAYVPCMCAFQLDWDVKRVCSSLWCICSWRPSKEFLVVNFPEAMQKQDLSSMCLNWSAQLILWSPHWSLMQFKKILYSSHNLISEKHCKETHWTSGAPQTQH